MRKIIDFIVRLLTSAQNLHAERVLAARGFPVIAGGAHEVPGYKMTRLTGADVAAFRFVKINSDGNVIQTAAVSDAAHGVAQAAAVSGRVCEVMVSGISKVEAGGAVTRGGLVTSDAVGKAVNAVATNVAYGIALEAATADLQRIAVLLFTPARVVAP